MVSYTDFDLEGKERVALVDLIHSIDRDIASLTSIDKNPTISRIIKKIGSLKFQRDKIELSIADHSSQYKVDQLRKVEDEIGLLIDVLEYINTQDKELENKMRSYRRGMAAFVKGSDLLQRFAFLQEWAEESYKEVVDGIDLTIKLLEEMKSDRPIDPVALNAFKEKFSIQSKKLYNLVTHKINEIINEPIR